METRLSLAPGQNGTKKLLARYGERLVCVRYRYDGVSSDCKPAWSPKTLAETDIHVDMPAHMQISISG
jgi:hypothetical protein